MCTQFPLALVVAGLYVDALVTFDAPHSVWFYIGSACYAFILVACTVCYFVVQILKHRAVMRTL